MRNAGPFPAEGSQLGRYAARLGAVEINSSFHRPHRRGTYERWAASVPDGFRFAVKMPKTITHERRLAGCGELLDRFAEEASGLAAKLAVVLVQLPPTLAFDRALAEPFFQLARERFAGLAFACEPRHLSWFDDGADASLAELGVTRVAADPARVPAAASPGGWAGLSYRRLHGSPVVYRSNYEEPFLGALAAELVAEHRAGTEVWCIFDNTTLSHALPNALRTSELLTAAAPDCVSA